MNTQITQVAKGMTKMSGYFVAYYKKHTSKIDSFNFPVELSKEDFANDFVYLMAVQADDMEEVFRFMQGEVWSPHGEAREIIKTLGLSHTSMSVGDIIFDPDAHNYWVVKDIGFMPVYIR
jgi:hypothetical protein